MKTNFFFSVRELALHLFSSDPEMGETWQAEIQAGIISDNLLKTSGFWQEAEHLFEKYQQECDEARYQ